LSAVQRVENPAAAFGLTDFRSTAGRQACRPLRCRYGPLTAAREWRRPKTPDAVAMLLIHDPLPAKFGDLPHACRSSHGLTNAEAHLVQALGNRHDGRGLWRALPAASAVTTVYTHLSVGRAKKTGWKSVAELTRRFL